MTTLIPLDAPVPPMLEAAIGYDGDARWVAFYWQPAGDEACWDDGRASLCGANWPAYLAYTRHPAVWPHLALYDFGSSDEPARHWLVLDRRERRLHAAPWKVASAALRQQERPAVERQEPTALPTVEELMAILSRPMSSDPTEVTAQMAHDEQTYRDLCVWLDERQKS